MDDAEQARIQAARWAMLLPHRDLAVGMVLRATGDPAEAEDCVHDAMLRLVRRDDLDPNRVRSLLVRAALHIAIDHRRSAGRRQSAVTRLAGGVAAEVTSPEQIVAQRAEAGRVLAAVDALPRRERQVILLRLAGLNVAETARRLGISAKSVEGAYTRARSRIRYLLGAVLLRLLDRMRRAASPRGEFAATAAAALLFAAPGLAGDGPSMAHALGPRPGATPPATQQAAHPTAVGAPPVPVGSDIASPLPPPATALPPGLLPPSGSSGFKKHNPPPDTQVAVPIDAPFGLASTGVYVSGLDTPPGDDIAAIEECTTQFHPWDTSDPC